MVLHDNSSIMLELTFDQLLQALSKLSFEDQQRIIKKLEGKPKIGAKKVNFTILSTGSSLPKFNREEINER